MWWQRKKVDFKKGNIVEAILNIQGWSPYWKGEQELHLRH
jgi:hypothetical protein